MKYKYKIHVRLGILIHVAIAFLCGYGWAINLTHVFYFTSQTPWGEFALGVVGIFIAPIGVFLGYFG